MPGPLSLRRLPVLSLGRCQDLPSGLETILSQTSKFSLRHLSFSEQLSRPLIRTMEHTYPYTYRRSEMKGERGAYMALSPAVGVLGKPLPPRSMSRS